MNKWKLAFFILLFSNFLIILISSGLLLMPGEKPPLKKEAEGSKDFAVFKVETDKQTVTKVINDYLKKEAVHQPLTYWVEITDDIKLYGSLLAFGRDLDMVMSFEPSVQQGNVILKVKSLSVGRLSVPVSYVLKYIDSQYHFPKEVQIDAKNRQIVVFLDQLSLENGSKIQAEKIDLEEGVISANLYVPLPLK
ncbi:YpmS family protein [Aeribacillus sp. FSL K6-1121]|uniref:YpmS family protein n=1 Tax=Aeribacillus TaxID=1055323 RepID=UPI002E236FBC|nr:YpmS family protein [Aeribacillus composti]